MSAIQKSLLSFTGNHIPSTKDSPNPSDSASPYFPSSNISETKDAEKPFCPNEHNEVVRKKNSELEEKINDLSLLCDNGVKSSQQLLESYRKRLAVIKEYSNSVDDSAKSIASLKEQVKIYVAQKNARV